MAIESPSSHHLSLKSGEFQYEDLRIQNGNGGHSNGVNEDNHCDDFSTQGYDMIPASTIKSEPLDYLDNDLDSQNARFNLRKRKASINSIDSSNGLKDVEAPREDGTKKRKKFVYSYTPNQLQEALDLVHSENISILTAAKQYGIPRSTLRRYALTVWAAAAPKSRTKQEPALTPPEEAHIVSMISKMSRAGKYVSTMDVKSTVQNLLDEGHRIVFKDRNRPTAGWVQRFRKRHKDLPLKGSGYTIKKPTPSSRQDVKEWYDEVSDYLLNEWELDPADFFTDKNMHRIYNLDEMTLSLNQKQDLIEENITGGYKNEEVVNEVTVLTAVSASGECMQPLIVQKGEGGGHDDDIMPLDQNSYGISFSISGKLNYEIFMRWLEAFDRELTEKDIPKPVIIFLDDVFAHFQISVFTYAIDNDIILLCLQSPNLQPIYTELCDQVKCAYREFCKEQYRLSGIPISMDQFPETFLKAWETVKDDPGVKERLKDSFRHFGMTPFNASATAFIDLPEVSEEPTRSLPKSEKSTKFPKEPKAKKTVSSKAANREKLLTSTSTLLPTVKIQKLEKQPSFNSLKIFDSVERSSFNGYEENSPQSPIESKIKQALKPVSHKSSKAVQSSQVPNERLIGRQDGIRKCLDLMESFIPSDIIAVWRNRGGELKNSSEIPYCMWKTVNNLLREMNGTTDKSSKNVKVNHTNSSGKNNSYKKKSKESDFINPMDYLQCESYEM